MRHQRPGALDNVAKVWRNGTVAEKTVERLPFPQIRNLPFIAIPIEPSDVLLGAHLAQQDIPHVAPHFRSRHSDPLQRENYLPLPRDQDRLVRWHGYIRKELIPRD